MRAVVKVFLLLFGMYAMLWLSVAAYFTYASGHAELLESNLSKVFGRTVSIGSVTTDWNGLSPRVLVHQFSVAGDHPDLPALAFDTLAAELDAGSALRLWPQFTEFAIERPRLEVVTRSARTMQVAGFTLRSGVGSGVSPKRLIQWLLDHENLVWHDGEIIWRRPNAELQRYRETSFTYRRQGLTREVRATTLSPKGVLAFTANSNGPILKASNWDASIEVLGDAGERLLSPEDLSFEVKDGRGRVLLKQLSVERIRDLIQLSGLSGSALWLMQAGVEGTLHDVKFEFAGALLDFSQWSLQANARDVAFEATATAPAMSGLHGKLSAHNGGGEFQFSAREALFSWPRLLETDIAVASAGGNLNWVFNDNGGVSFTLSEGNFQDQITRISELNASIEFDNKERRVSNVGQLFKLKSIGDLNFEDGTMVTTGASTDSTIQPLYLDASMKFEVSDMRKLVAYIPAADKLQRFRTWWSNAIVSGAAKNGRLSYRGELASNAIAVGKAQLRGRADYQNVEIDYGYQRNWPVVRNGRGSATLQNDVLTFGPQEVWLENDQILDPALQITDLFQRARRLDLSGRLQTSLATVAEFLFDGPLIKPSQRGRKPPVNVTAGRVDAEVKISVPLSRVSQATVKGMAQVSGGALLLPPGVPVSNIRTQMQFTERSASADMVLADFLGYPARASLLTTSVAQPPVLTLNGRGVADVKLLEPWVGEHLLSWFSGTTPWSGAVVIDGPRSRVSMSTDLMGVEVSAPEPLYKPADEPRALELNTALGGSTTARSLELRIGDQLSVAMAGDLQSENLLFDRARISIGENAEPTGQALREGIHFDVVYPQLDLDEWLGAIIDLTNIETTAEQSDTSFLDAMRSVRIQAEQPVWLERSVGSLKINGLSVDGAYWIGAIEGSNIDGTLQASPRAEIPSFKFELARLHLPNAPKDDSVPAVVDRELVPASYPRMELLVESFKIGAKRLGRLDMLGRPDNDIWILDRFTLEDKGISTVVTGQWTNNAEAGTISNFNYQTSIRQAGDVLEGMDLADVLKKGKGDLVGNLNWIGAPHEFDYARLNGDFDLRISDGELVKVEPGGGKLLGLLNFNAIARRLTLDFRDVFASGLQFDRMRYAGVLADGKAIMRDAYIFAPAIFVQMEGSLDLDQELVDLEIHMSPELGGNLTLLSALANPAAGAVMFLTQQLFKDEMRASSFQSYRAKGSWEDFDLVEIERNGEPKKSAGVAARPDLSGSTEKRPNQQ
ncbi:MAG: hypothetical protein HKN50_01920 [Gammaproteobacteria bacterium]|nr:hypothetical protein [Gammaproteobacteria bacterium]